MKFIKSFKLFESKENQINTLIEDIRIECQKLGVKMILENEEKVDLPGSNVKSSGYFDSENQILAVGVKKKIDDWLIILIHESCHMDQWAENSKIWQDYINCEYDIWGWLEGSTELNQSELKNGINASKNLELDCEKRAVEKIKEYKLDNLINIDEYIKKSNSYVLFYNYMLKYKKWYNKPPYEIKDIIDIMPNNFNINYDELTEEMEKKFHLTVE
jgi:hypothetical protein